MNGTVLFNPYTGRPRDPRDIASDPQGLAIVEPDAPLLAAALSQPSEEARDAARAVFTDIDAVHAGYAITGSPQGDKINRAFLAGARWARDGAVPVSQAKDGAR